MQTLFFPLTLVLLLAGLCAVLGCALWRARGKLRDIETGLDGLPGAFALWRGTQRLIVANRHYQEIHSGAFQKLGKRLSYEAMTRSTLSRSLAGEALDEEVKNRVTTHTEAANRSTDRLYPGGEWFRVTKTVAGDGLISGFAVEISDLKRREQEHSTALEALGFGTWRRLHDGTLSLGGGMRELHGLPADAPVDSIEALCAAVHAEDRASLDQAIQAMGSVRDAVEVKYRVLHPTLGERWLEANLRGEHHETSLSLGMYAIVQDVSDRVRNERSLERLAFYDPLTGLPNRAMFQREAVRRLSPRRANRQDALLLIDLDNFKEVNDRLGHEAGDKLLALVGERMLEVIRPRDFLARLGGDEFAILLSDGGDDDAMQVVADRLQAAVQARIDLSGTEIRTSLSIGIARFGVDGEDLEALLRNADLALYQVKEHGRAGCAFYDPRMFERNRKRIDMSAALREALAKEELWVAYQPQYRLADETLAGCEALLRWQSASFGAVPPSEFIPVAEGSTLISEIGMWVIEKAAREAVGWPGIDVSVNLSAAQFAQLDLVDEISRVLDRSGLPAGRLCLELTESLFVDRDRARAVGILMQLHKMGVRLAIDDFGTGYSSLAYLRDLPFDEIKIDRSFINRCDVDESQQALISGLVNIARSLEMRVVVEGIERKEQLEVVRTLGCDLVQGFLFSPPVPSPQILPMIQTSTAQLSLAQAGPGLP